MSPAKTWMRKFFVPAGSNTPFHMDLIFYNDTTCSSEVGKVKLNRLLNDTNKAHYLFINIPEDGDINFVALMLDEVNEKARETRQKELVSTVQRKLIVKITAALDGEYIENVHGDLEFQLTGKKNLPIK